MSLLQNFSDRILLWLQEDRTRYLSDLYFYLYNQEIDVNEDINQQYINLINRLNIGLNFNQITDRNSIINIFNGVPENIWYYFSYIMTCIDNYTNLRSLESEEENWFEEETIENDQERDDNINNDSSISDYNNSCKLDDDEFFDRLPFNKMLS